MTDVFAITEAALRASMAQLDTVSRNVANAGTQGYKRELRIEPAFDQQLARAGQSAGTDQVAALHDWSRGPLRHTGAPLQFAIEGEGWFQLQSPQGVLLTRDGSFQLDRQGRLVSAQGWPVVMDGEARFSDPAPSLRPNDELWSEGTRIAQLLLVKADPATLQVAGPNLFRAATTTTLDPGSAGVRQGFLESSNVSSLTEMVDLMQSMRQAEAAQRAAHAYDEALEMAISTLGEF